MKKKNTQNKPKQTRHNTLKDKLVFSNTKQTKQNKTTLQKITVVPFLHK